MAKGKVVLKLDNDISTDIIYPGRYMATVLPTETPQFAFADNAGFNQALKEKQVPAGSCLVHQGLRPDRCGPQLREDIPAELDKRRAANGHLPWYRGGGGR